MVTNRSVVGGLYQSPIHDQLVKGIRVLDVGCGPGWWTLVSGYIGDACI